ncbi:hypothetical protein D9611_011487 [Ephemerocybe angulata]|uniref:BTB domain-containing protein n=1 Tax=Ephemerocybe angulata TaxID=980116 RepID=A0A8H5CE38_9AGAR|nr:hypothetical protein D9611_011487 [Tulosesus angulatus]
MASPTSTERKVQHTPEDYRWSLVTFKVQDKLYRVPRHGFTRYSDLFESMFTLPQGDSSEGQSEQNPIVLPSCSTIDFENLLGIMYPTAPRISPVEVSEEEWVSVLKLATLWGMDKMLDVAVNELSGTGVSSIKKVCLGRKYRCPALLLLGYTEIINSWGNSAGSEYLDELGLELSWETTARLSNLVVKHTFSRGPLGVCGSASCACRGEYQPGYRLPSNLSETSTSILACGMCNQSLAIALVSLSDPETLARNSKLENAIKETFKGEFSIM